MHRYYDSFFLTAFTAEEDLSANGQIFYENPALVTNPAAYVPDQLLGLGTVLESYLRQKKSPTEALQAYKAKSPNLGSRLIGGSVIQDPDTFGLMAKIATQAAPALLDSVFKPFKDQLPYPTMLYVTWGESKVTGLAGVSSRGCPAPEHEQRHAEERHQHPPGRVHLQRQPCDRRRQAEPQLGQRGSGQDLDQLSAGQKCGGL